MERGRLVIPPDADVVSFLLSDGRINGRAVVPEQTTLKGLFDAYFNHLWLVTRIALAANLNFLLLGEGNIPWDGERVAQSNA